MRMIASSSRADITTGAGRGSPLVALCFGVFVGALTAIGGGLAVVAGGWLSRRIAWRHGRS